MMRRAYCQSPPVAQRDVSVSSLVVPAVFNAALLAVCSRGSTVAPSGSPVAAKMVG